MYLRQSMPTVIVSLVMVFAPVPARCDGEPGPLELLGTALPDVTEGRIGTRHGPVVDAVAALYRRLLEREPDVPGLAYHVERVVSGRSSLAAVEQAMQRSPEYLRLHPEAPVYPSTKSSTTLMAAAQNLDRNVRRACYRTAVATAAANGGIGNGWLWWGTTAYRNRSLASLYDALADGTLRPGMVVYMNTAPGADRSSTNLSYRPHWMTYLGPDADGIPRFSDNFGTSYTVSDVISTYGPRLLDTFFNPYRRL